MPGSRKNQKRVKARQASAEPAAMASDACCSGASDVGENSRTQVILKDSAGNVIPGMPLGEAKSSLKLRGYKFLTKLGQGGMGTVYLARQRSLDRYVAIKVISPHKGSAHIPESDLKGEAKTMALLSHPNILDCYDIVRNDKGLFLVMAYVPGRLTARMLVERYGAIEERYVARMLLDMVNGLAYIHKKGYLHCDLKPDNLMIHRELGKGSCSCEELFQDAGTRVVICDFGIAKDVSVTHDDGRVVGSPMYMSPEQACASADLDFRSDIYSMGCVAYFLLTGRPPFTQTNRDELLDYKLTHDVPEPHGQGYVISREMVRIVCRMGKASASERYGSYGELQEDIERLAAERSAWYDRSRRVRTRRLVVRQIVYAVLLALVCQSVWLFYQNILSPYFQPVKIDLSQSLGYWYVTGHTGWQLIQSDVYEESAYLRFRRLGGREPLVLMQPLRDGMGLDFKLRFLGPGKVSFGLRDGGGRVLMSVEWHSNGQKVSSFRMRSGDDRMTLGVQAVSSQLEWLPMTIRREGERVLVMVREKTIAAAYIGDFMGEDGYFFLQPQQAPVTDLKDVYRLAGE